MTGIGKNRVSPTRNIENRVARFRVAQQFDEVKRDRIGERASARMTKSKSAGREPLPTAIIRSANDTTGIALVEVYALN